MQGVKYKIPSLSRNSKRHLANEVLPTIPDKRYFTIGEVGLLCGVKPHVLRYWEQEFSQIKPGKRRGNRRYYQYNDVVIIRQIRKLLYENGFTIEGARAQLAANPTKIQNITQSHDEIVKKLIEDLENVLEQLKTESTS